MSTQVRGCGDDIIRFMNTHPCITLCLSGNEFTEDEKNRIITNWKKNIYYLSRTKKINSWLGISIDLERIRIDNNGVHMQFDRYPFNETQTHENFLAEQKDIINKEIKTTNYFFINC